MSLVGLVFGWSIEARSESYGTYDEVYKDENGRRCEPCCYESCWVCHNVVVKNKFLNLEDLFVGERGESLLINISIICCLFNVVECGGVNREIYGRVKS